MRALAGLARDAPAASRQVERQRPSATEAALERDADRTADAVLAGRRPAAPQRATPDPGRNATQHPSDVRAARDTAARGGTPLSLASRAYFEPRFGHDLSQVRVHPEAEAADRMAADAFAFGNHIAFAPARYAPETPAGRNLLAHELAHVVQQRDAPAPIVQRRGKEKDADAAGKPQIVAITAIQGALEGEATLSNQKTVPVKLKQNELLPGTHELYHIGAGRYQSAGEKTPDGKPAPKGFVWYNPWTDKSQKAARYDWAENVTVTITQTAAQRISSLPAHIRRFLTTDDPNAPVGSDIDLEQVANAGELLAAGNFSQDEIALLEEQMRRARERSGNAAQADDPYQWAQNYLAGRAQKQQVVAKNRDDLLGLARQLGAEPLHEVFHGQLGDLLDPNDKAEIGFAARITGFYRDQGRIQQIEGADAKAKLAFLKSQLYAFQDLLHRFEAALVRDLRSKGADALDAAEAALLRMDRKFVGMRQDSKPAPNFFWTELARIRNNPVIKRAAELRDMGKQELVRIEQEDRAKHENPYTRQMAPLDYVEFSKRQETRDAKKDELDQAFEKLARVASGLSLPPNASLQKVIAARDADQAHSLLRDYLYDGFVKISRARDKLASPKFLFSADIWVKNEEEGLHKELGGELGSQIAKLVGAFAKLRQSEKSFWEQLLQVIEFVSMFVPGPVGWITRAVVGTIRFTATAERLTDQHTLYSVGASAFDASSAEAFGALTDLVFSLVPDAPAGAATEKRLGKTLTHEAEQVTEGAAERSAVSGTANAGDDVARTGTHADPLPEAPSSTGTVPERAPGEAPTGTVPDRTPDEVPTGGGKDGPTGGGNDHGGGGGGGHEGETDMRGRVGKGRSITVRGQHEIDALSLEDLRRHEQALIDRRRNIAEDLNQTEHNINTLEERIEKLKEKNPRRTDRLKGEDNLDALRREANDARDDLAELDKQLGTVRGDIDRIAPPPNAPPVPVKSSGPPIGDFPFGEKPTTLAGTQMNSWRPDAYVAASQSGYRKNVETLLSRDPDGPLSKALLKDGRRVPYDPSTVYLQDHPEVFVAGHVHSKHAASQDVIILTSARRNARFNNLIETTGGERFSDFAYVIQGIAVEPGTAWELVEAGRLERKVVELARKIPLTQ